MELVAADVNQLSGMRKLTPLERGCRALIGGAGEYQKAQDHGGCEQKAADPREDHGHPVRRLRQPVAPAGRATS
jgi:hypothetical protein